MCHLMHGYGVEGRHYPRQSSYVPAIEMKLTMLLLILDVP